MIERDGNRLVVRGAVTLADVSQWRESGLAAIDRDGLTIDLAGVSEADSSALSLLLEWQRAAKARGFGIRYRGLATLSRVRSSPAGAWPETCTRAVSLCTTVAPSRASPLITL